MTRYESDLDATDKLANATVLCNSTEPESTVLGLRGYENQAGERFRF
jgi:hypothetical protein